LWQLFAAVFLVGGTSAGSIVLSYNTPTVGLGCRTGGYIVFFVVALVLMLAEALVWWLTSPLRKQDRFRSHFEDYTRRLANGHHQRPKHTSFPGLAASRSVLSRLLKAIERAVLQVALLPIRVFSRNRKNDKKEAMQTSVREHFATLQNLTVRNWLQRAFFTPLECCNMIWACYLVFAQTIGAFNNCACMTSSWDGSGGYLDFTQFNVTDSPLVAKYWIQGTVITCVVMGLGMGYIVLEVCLTILICTRHVIQTDTPLQWLIQAHLSTEDYKDAMTGLQRVRRFRRFSQWLRYPLSLFVSLINSLLEVFRFRRTADTKVLAWSKESCYQPTVGHSITQLVNEAQHLPFHEVNKTALARGNEAKQGAISVECSSPVA
jgi:hypothetical protein